MTESDVLVASGAAVRLGGREIWSDVDVRVPAGSFTAVLGPNGAGKSTLLRVALGMLPVVRGDVELLGRPAGQARAEVGYLPQRRTFAAGARVRCRDVVRLGVDGHRWGLALPGRRSREAEVRVRELIAMVGAQAFADQPIGEVSGGEQQRVLIAQALAREPRLLMLDEPLDSLDLPNQAAVASLLGEICADQGVAVVMVAHDVNPILGWVDQVVYLAGGRAVSGAPRDVITTGTLTALYGTPVEVLHASDGRLVVVGQPEAPAHHSDRHQH